MALGAPARDALAAMGIVTPTPIQQAAIPPLLAGRDAVGEAPTGSGKTLAFGLPLAERIEPKRRVVQALVLVPTRELAAQVEQVLLALGERHGFRTLVISGGRSANTQAAALRGGAQVVVGTPGRVLDLLQRGTLTLQHLRLLVLDEADEMLDRGFAPDVERILARTPASRQTALFSATMPPWVRTTADRHLREPVAVRVEPAGAVKPRIEHVVYDVADGERLPALQALLDARGAGTTLVFGRTKHGVKALCKRLAALGYPVAALQGNLSQNARDRVVAEVRAGRVPILVATNVAARGIDIDHIERVINYELPETPELFTHRVGRTGRMGRQGVAVTLLAPADLVRWRQFERSLGHALPRRAWAGPGAATRSRAPAPAAGRAPVLGRAPGDARRARPAPPPATPVGTVRPARSVSGQPTPVPNSARSAPRRDDAGPAVRRDDARPAASRGDVRHEGTSAAPTRGAGRPGAWPANPRRIVDPRQPRPVGSAGLAGQAAGRAPAGAPAERASVGHPRPAGNPSDGPSRPARRYSRRPNAARGAEGHGGSRGAAPRAAGAGGRGRV